MTAPATTEGAIEALRRLAAGAMGAPSDPSARREGVAELVGERRAARAERDCRAVRVQEAGGGLVPSLAHPAVTVFEHVFRREPEQGIHSPLLDPDHPMLFEMGAFRVPKQQALLLFELRPDVYRFSGIDPNDSVPVAARRFSNVMGWDVNIDGSRPRHTRYELDPIPRQLNANAYIPEVPQPGNVQPAAVFAQARRNRFGSAAGTGLATLPQRPQRYGALALPFTLAVREGQVVQLAAIIFRTIQSPIAFFEFGMAGILMPAEWTDRIFECIRPV